MIRGGKSALAGRHQLYRYASRYLMERVSWLCRDHRKPDTGNGQAEVIFSNRSQMSYDELRGYAPMSVDGST